MAQTKGKKTMLSIGVVVAGIAALWYGIFGLKPYSLSAEELTERYAYNMTQQVQLELKQLTPQSFDFTYQSFDGVTVNGRIHYPENLKTITTPVPVLIGAHAMGRSQIRWWQDSFKDRATFEQTDKITAMALAKGYAVVAIDARHHGLRKDPELSVVDIIDNLHWWGEREPYETMLVDTVRDHRVLLDWLVQQPQLDSSKIKLAGYSMGAQISLLLAGVDSRIQSVAAIVPPHMNSTTALVAPLNLMAGLADNQVWLFTADDDEYASIKQNQQLFDALPNPDKKLFRFDSGHLLPADYVKDLEPWL
ncbi:MAG: alpha/beta fold hydrolase [Gammaproteobacteria bacterium]|nr:alpha/beta fold hydrolase [Gammaproteobacteria bacterium]MBU2056507.1 alpha/beta fold hydrolase [Gammaproteobacteria bacterium]MBU2174230.1 alpha/beta fold hydrolase [Gammaproteobacteria bacterium]MBU2248719.1 alpha/beta fold hydrolase [Gammaproteobacteria bacterium]MBU2344643.1 alpha/beta fold hydrolase [Gammaproteobacteria bacterium]